MKKVLVVHYSQSGQLDDVACRFTQALCEEDAISVHFEALKPLQAFPFPWPFWQFFDTFPETVYLDPPPIENLSLKGDEDFDLIILAYQVWFLSPSLPVTAFLQSAKARQLMQGKPVVTLIACRNMWLQAQEQVKQLLEAAEARLVGNVALVDEAGSLGSFLATPLWVLSGNKGAKLGGLIPRAGVKPEEIEACSRFGERIRDVMLQGGPIDESLLSGLGAVQVDERLIASETVARRSFRVWGGLLRLCGPHGSWRRKPILLIYILFLLTLILTFLPISMLVKKLFSPLFKQRIRAQKAYYALPSGE